MGMSTFGSWSTESFWYENAPRTMNATIIMVAKTGLLTETRVIHMGSALLAVLHHSGGAGLEPVGLDRDHRHALLEALAHLDEAALGVANADGEGAPLDLAVLEHVGERLPAFLDDRGRGNHVHLGAHRRVEHAVREHPA